jgi:hypothetical protein
MFIIAGVLAAALVAGAPAVRPVPDSSFPRIRPLDSRASRLLEDGRRRSPTLAALVRDLERRDVVVYVAVSPGVASRGSLCFVMRSAPLTYVLARIDAQLDGDRAIAALGHELWHGWEVAGATPPVSSGADLAALYRRIGAPSGRDAFESDLALVTERAIRRELAGRATTRDP